MHTDISIHTNTFFSKTECEQALATCSVVRRLTNVCSELRRFIYWCIQCQKNGLENVLTLVITKTTLIEVMVQSNRFCSIHNVDHRKNFYTMYI